MHAEEIILWVGFIEYVFLAFFLIFVVSFKWVLDRKIERDARKKKELIQFFSKKVTDNFSNREEELPLKSSPHILLEALEEFQRIFLNEQWQDYCAYIFQCHLVVYAKQWSKSRFWIRRNRAARIFLLEPREEQSPYCLPLLTDSSFYIRSLAAFWAMRVGTLSTIQAFFEQMAKEKETLHYAYCQAASDISYATYQHIFILYQKTENPMIQCCILQVIGKKITTDHIDLIEKDLYNKTPCVRCFAIKWLAKHYGERVKKHLRQLVYDCTECVRETAIQRLGKEKQIEDLPIFERALSDPCGSVRFAAAQTLRNWGNVGMQILEKQDPIKNKEAYHIARFALTMP